MAHELKASVQARRELDADMEDHIIEAFLARIESRVDARVSQQLGKSGSRPVEHKHDGADIGVIAGSFALSIPLVAIAGGIAGAIGIVAVMCALIAVNLLYFIDRWVRFNLR